MRDRLKDPSAMEGDIVNAPGSFWDGAEIVSAYTRAQAIDDGVLVDLSRHARFYGIRFPVAMTRTAWTAALCEPRADGKPSDIDLGRFLACLADALRSGGGGDRRLFTFLRIDQAETPLKIICGPGDTAAPVLTVMLPNED